MNIFQRFLSWTKSLMNNLMTESEDSELKTKEKAPIICQVEGCDTELNIINGKKCGYCKQYYCITHIAPAEKHNCKGKLRTIPGGHRVLYSGGKREIIST